MTEAPAPWTIDRLARLAAAALAAGAPTQPNGRIREVPDVRTIRWYTSIGLLDRPAAMRGRTALYGRSHLAQLVAIKRLQASGLTVAAVQERLLGAEASVVEQIAELPADLDALIAPADPDAAGPATSPARSRFWITPPAAEPFTTITADTEADTEIEAGPDTTAPLITGIRLTTDITLLLPPGRTPDAAARAAITEAAQPLLDLLNRLGLSEA
ncbi:MerR family transcriptional regulator [Catenulispora sp. NF23]|uniref:MerR family transcriptional regulator n=1 Tax=Catenulispora pinistramenti TaxID=2705254 RepID=A0ABS5KVF0_9ACTN|nr:helix-turn-helix domain-containing protein [Catenulispora pinistramenti]MBS2534971.1 MerR family transcriptional regulator [Catenulispora pinistramenti]MBS2550028.1 MerR family transcriptional regulator [Catenulispora pinistramenti]